MNFSIGRSGPAVDKALEEMNAETAARLRTKTTPLDQSYVDRVTAAAKDVSAELDACEQDLCLRDIRREVEADEQTYLLAALLRKLSAVAHSHWARTYLTECAEQLDHLGRDLAERRLVDEIEWARTMSTPQGRRAVAEGRD